MSEKKTLARLVHDRSFLARRHAGLLESEPLVEDVNLRGLQLAYRAEESELERRALARQFEKRSATVAGDEELTLPEWLLAGLGPGVALHDILPLGELDELERKWERWEKRGDGFSWRVAHGQMHNEDRIRAYERLTGRHEENLDVIAQSMPDLADRARGLLPKRKPPTPPGWRHLVHG